MVQTSITYKLASLSEDAIASADLIFRQRFGLHIHEIRVLRLIADAPGVTFTELTRLTKLDRSATSRMVTRLIKAGYVKRVAASDDARRFQLYVTPKATRLRERADPLTQELEELIFSVLLPAERRGFEDCVERMSAWVHGDFLDVLSARYPEVAQARAGTGKAGQ